METTNLFGIPVPSTDPVFLAFVFVHILISLAAVVSGLLAMFSEKTSTMHKINGRVYFWSISTSFVTVVILSIMRWPHNIHLLTIGILTLGLTFTGRKLAKTKPRLWARLHTICMGLSYVLLLTGFYVDNGKNLPFWNLFPQWFFYVFPTALGIPIILRVLKTHPLNRWFVLISRIFFDAPLYWWNTRNCNGSNKSLPVAIKPVVIVNVDTMIYYTTCSGGAGLKLEDWLESYYWKLSLGSQ